MAARAATAIHTSILKGDMSMLARELKKLQRGHVTVLNEVDKDVRSATVAMRREAFSSCAYT
jgi:hypothetical protein